MTNYFQNGRGLGRLILSLLVLLNFNVPIASAQANESTYLEHVKAELKKTWPNNRAINLVFHGHSVPSGYFRTPDVRTLDAYPQQVLKELTALYPTAVINVIVTAIGGENSVQGQKRMKKEVLVHRPDVLFIDYALNDRRVGLEDAREATEKMIQSALKKKIPVILLTPSPDLKVDLTRANNELEQFAIQIKEIAKQYNIGVADSYAQFRALSVGGQDVAAYMSQSNHPNAQGHALIAGEVLKFFR